MTTPLKILHITPELAPLMSTGGLAEVAQALPIALRAKGHDVRVAMPKYRSIPDAAAGRPYCICEADFLHKKEFGALRVSVIPDTDIPLYLIEHEGYFGRQAPYSDGAYEYADNAERFCFFCLAVLHGIPQLDWIPDVIHCHDWHCAMLPVYLRTRFNSHPLWHNTPTVLTIHNLAFQGRYGAEKFPQTGFDDALMHQDLEYYGDINLLKAGILNATKISTVSPRYAEEIQTSDYGEGLDGILRQRRSDLVGILNGANYAVWNPKTDPFIAAPFSAVDPSGKAECKRALQVRVGLPQESETPVFSLISRLSWQKGIDLIMDDLDSLFTQPAQLIVLGTGDRDLEARLRAAKERYPDRISINFAFDSALAHAMQAGADFLLMPSRFEPCGLSQIFAMKYGTIPIVRRTGGLADTVKDWNAVYRKNNSATGLSFVPRTPQALTRALLRAQELYADKTELTQVRKNAMQADYSWDRSCAQYIQLYEEAIHSTRYPETLSIGA